MKRICIDLDGVIAELKLPGQSYGDVGVVPGAVEKLRALKESGHYLILNTARHMKTCNGNVGLVQARVGKQTLDWLAKHEVPYDEVFFGKPWAQIYLDDNAMRFNSWDEIDGDGSSVPRYSEDEFRKDIK